MKELVVDAIIVDGCQDLCDGARDVWSSPGFTMNGEITRG